MTESPKPQPIASRQHRQPVGRRFGDGAGELRRLTRRIARCGEAAASMSGLACVTERSPGSESVYLHVFRGGRWRGVRVSCHPPAYDCCRDYQQLVLPRRPTAGQLAVARRVIASLVRLGGLIVSDPRAVAAAIDRLAGRLSHGRRYVDRAGCAWRWDAAADAWRSASGAPRDTPPPTHRGVRVVSPRVRCDVRHAMNVTAAWEAELTAPD